MKVLLVDDSRLVFSIVKSIFEENKIELKWAGNGKAGIDIIHADEQFDLILLDWNMPVLDGPSFLKEFKKHKKFVMPVLMLTTENSAVHIEKALELGVSEYIMKPFTGDILISKINSVLEVQKVS